MDKNGYVHFAGWLVGVSVALPIFLLVLHQLTGIDLRSSFSSVFPMMVAAAMSGIRYGRETGRRPSNSEAWSISIRLTGLGFALSVALILLLLPTVGGALPPLSPAYLAVIVAFMIGIYLVLARVFFALGAKNQVERGGKGS